MNSLYQLMRRRAGPIAIVIFLSLPSLLAITAVSRADESALNQGRIEQLTGLKGSYDAKEAVFTVRFPRNDLNVNSGPIHVATRRIGSTRPPLPPRPGP